MIILTSLLVSLAAVLEPAAYYYPPQPTDNDSYFGRENDPYNEDYVRMPTAPPPVVIEQPSPPPDPSYVWTPGYWRWDTEAEQWRWIAGQWLNPPYPGAKWQAGYWQKTPDGWVWRKGRWKE